MQKTFFNQLGKTLFCVWVVEQDVLLIAVRKAIVCDWQFWKEVVRRTSWRWSFGSQGRRTGNEFRSSFLGELLLWAQCHIWQWSPLWLFCRGLLFSELWIGFIQILCLFMAVSHVSMLSKVFLLPIFNFAEGDTLRLVSLDIFNWILTQGFLSFYSASSFSGCFFGFVRVFFFPCIFIRSYFWSCFRASDLLQYWCDCPEKEYCRYFVV